MGWKGGVFTKIRLNLCASDQLSETTALAKHCQTPGGETGAGPYVSLHRRGGKRMPLTFPCTGVGENESPLRFPAQAWWKTNAPYVPPDKISFLLLPRLGEPFDKENKITSGDIVITVTLRVEQS